MIDWHEYVICVMKYIFDENPQVTPLLNKTECRTMLMNYGFTEEQMEWVEHNVLLAALAIMGDTHAYIRNMSMNRVINGFYWNVTNTRDLEIKISYY